MGQLPINNLFAWFLLKSITKLVLNFWQGYVPLNGHWFNYLQGDFLLRHYTQGPCKDKLGHTRAAVVWYRAQVVALFFGFGLLALAATPVIIIAAPCLFGCSRLHKECEKRRNGSRDRRLKSAGGVHHLGPGTESELKELKMLSDKIQDVVWTKLWTVMFIPPHFIYSILFYRVSIRMWLATAWFFHIRRCMLINFAFMVGWLNDFI
jgi:hypothetical protein